MFVWPLGSPGVGRITGNYQLVYWNMVKKKQPDESKDRDSCAESEAQTPVPSEVLDPITIKLRKIYQSTVDEGVPEHFTELLRQLKTSKNNDQAED